MPASRYQTQPLAAVDKNYEMILFQNYGAATSQVVKIPEPTLLWGPSNNPVASIPAGLINNPSLNVPAQSALPPGNSFITALSVCDRLQIFIDNRVAV